MAAQMAKRAREVALNTRTARMKLAPRHKPYFRLMADGVHIGYRRSTVAGRAGTWLVRRYLSAGTYETELLATADDTADTLAEIVRDQGTLPFHIFDDGTGCEWACTD